jgi:hypothetical protein
MLTAKEKDDLTILIKGERPPESGMEKHFLNVLNGNALPCSPQEKEWHQYWLQNIEGNAVPIVKNVNATPKIAKSTTKRRKAEVITKQRQADNAAREQDRLIKEAKLIQAIQLNKKLDKLEQSRKKSGRGTGAGFAGGWTSLKQGERKVGDAVTKQYISEGIAGTRDENKKMRGQLGGDMLKRARGR